MRNRSNDTIPASASLRAYHGPPEAEVEADELFPWGGAELFRVDVQPAGGGWRQHPGAHPAGDLVQGGLRRPVGAPQAEAALVGQAANEANFRKAAAAALRDAKPQSENKFKIELAKRCLTHALQMAATA